MLRRNGAFLNICCFSRFSHFLISRSFFVVMDSRGGARIVDFHFVYFMVLKVFRRCVETKVHPGDPTSPLCSPTLYVMDD